MLSSLTISPLIRCTTLVPVHILARGLENTLTAYQRCADCGFFRCADPRPTDRLAAFGALLSRPGKPGMYPFLDDRALEFGKYAQHLEERASAVLHFHAAMGMPVGLRGIGRVGRLSLPRRRLGASAQHQ